MSLPVALPHRSRALLAICGVLVMTLALPVVIAQVAGMLVTDWPLGSI